MTTTRPEPDTEHLLAAARRGDTPARGRLLQRQRLRRMVAVRLDRRLAARVDPSDVVQDTLADADRHLDEYCGTGRCRSTRGCGGGRN